MNGAAVVTRPLPLAGGGVAAEAAGLSDKGWPSADDDGESAKGGRPPAAEGGRRCSSPFVFLISPMLFFVCAWDAVPFVRAPPFATADTSWTVVRGAM